MKLPLPQFVLECLSVLNSAGFEAWCVGGCVRDLLLGKIPTDYDVTTNAPPQAVAALFPRHFETGIRFGTVTAVMEEGMVEITTYRTEGKYNDRRRPDTVSYASSLKEDVSRRDFTINAIAYHPTKGLRDYNNGLDDLKRRCIRTVGNPVERFSEDALRILRAFRFACQLDFEIEEMTLSAALELRDTLSAVSKERRTTEFMKAMAGGKPSFLAPLFSIEALSELDAIAAIPEVRLAALCYIWRQEAGEVLSMLRLPHKLELQVNQVCCLLSAPLPRDKAEMKQCFLKLSPTFWMPYLEAYHIIRKVDISEAVLMFYDIERNEEPWQLSQLAVTGSDLIHAGVPSGKEVGLQLNRLLCEVRRKPSLNTKEHLLSLL